MLAEVDAGGPYVGTLPVVQVVGNVSYADGTPFEGAQINISLNDTASTNVSLTTSSDGAFATNFTTLGVGTYFVNVTSNVTGLVARVNDTFRIEAAYSCEAPQSFSISGYSFDYDTGNVVSVGNVTVTIKETNDETTASVTNGLWTVTFSTCLDSGKRYTVGIKTMDQGGKASWSQIQFISP